MFIVEKEPKSIWAETYRNLKANMKYLTSCDEGTSILITSSDKSEGKTTISSNLAIALAQDGEQVILIDCNLRNPSICNNFDITNNNGLTDILEEKIEFQKAIKKHSSGISIITSGKDNINPSKLLGSKAMDFLLEDLKKKYKYIILDGAALHEFSDSKVLSLKSDSTILVARAEKTLKNSILDAKKELEKTKVNILGVVINDIPKGARKHYNLKVNEDRHTKKFLLSKFSLKSLRKKNSN